MPRWPPWASSFVPRRFRSLSIGGILLICLVIWFGVSIPSSPGNDLPKTQSPGPRPIADPDASILKHVKDVISNLPEPAVGADISAIDVSTPTPIPVLIFAHNRADSLRRTLDSVLSAAPAPASLHPIFVSQDGDDAAVAAVIASYGARITHLIYHWPGEPVLHYRTAYLRIAAHYAFALAAVLDNHKQWNRIIMLEDDMDVAPDFFGYFRRLSPLFDIDPSLYCVSAWNSNGQRELVHSPTALYRTDCFPGLGWMWSRALWEELRGWTFAHWDEWLRDEAQRKGRTCVFPEVNRVYTFDAPKASSLDAAREYLVGIRLNDVSVNWEGVDVEYLLPGKYDEWMMARLRRAERVEDVEEAKAAIERDVSRANEEDKHDVKERWFSYRDLDHLTEIMMPIGLMPDHKNGIPRTSYRGVLQFRFGGVRIWTVPDSLVSSI